MHSLLGDLVDVTMAEALFHSYSDSGLFGNYFFGNEVFTRQMNYCGVCLPTIYSHYMNDVEVIRSRNHIYNTLMRNSECQTTTNSEIGQQMIQQGRRVPRSEVAKRIAHFDAYHMKHMCNHWFYDAEPTFTNWGPVETVASAGTYKYFKVNTMSTVANMHHTLFQ
jgi:processing peptidase subunit beta